MISFANINKQYGKQLLFVMLLSVESCEKVGLVVQWAGKTTLFRMVVGEETRRGRGLCPRKLTIGYFRQDVEEMQAVRLLDEAIAGSDASAICTRTRSLAAGNSDPTRLMTWTHP